MENNENLKNVNYNYDFIRATNHEVNNSLTSVISLVTMLDRLASEITSNHSTHKECCLQLAEKIKKYSRPILSEVWKISNLSQNLSIVSSFKTEDSSISVYADLGICMKQAMQRIKRIIPNKDVKIVSDHDLKDPKIAMLPLHLTAFLGEIFHKLYYLCEHENNANQSHCHRIRPFILKICTKIDGDQIQVMISSHYSKSQIFSHSPCNTESNFQQDLTDFKLTTCLLIANNYSCYLSPFTNNQADPNVISVEVHLPIAKIAV